MLYPLSYGRNVVRAEGVSLSEVLAHSLERHGSEAGALSRQSVTRLCHGFVPDRIFRILSCSDVYARSFRNDTRPFVGEGAMFTCERSQ